MPRQQDQNGWRSTIKENSMRHGPTNSGEILSMNEIERQGLDGAYGSVERLKAASSRSQRTTVSSADVRRAIVERRNRDKFFPENMFADPAWDMLLELYAAELGQVRVTISSLCAGAAVPPTTALRWISTLEREALIYRRKDPTDGRRIFAGLSAKGLIAMENYFESNAGRLSCGI